MKKLLHLIIFLIPFVGSAQTTVTYTKQIGNNFTTFNAGTAGSFNNGSAEMGMYANSSGAKQTVAWRQFRTADNNGGSLRALKIGDKFTITVAAKRAYGKIGVSLLASPSTYSSYADRENNYAISVNLDGPLYAGGSTYGAWYIKYNGGTTSATSYTGVQGTYYDYTLQFTLTSVNSHPSKTLFNFGA